MATLAAARSRRHVTLMAASRPVPASDPRRFSDRARPASRWRAGLAVAVLHALVAWALIASLGASKLVRPAERFAIQAYNVVTTPLQPPRKPVETRPSGVRAPAAKEAVASPVVVPPRPPIVPPTVMTAPAQSVGEAPKAGAAPVGAGSGAGGPGAGTGAGEGGVGNGGGIARKPVQIAGSISSTRDYPPDRDLHRIGTSVTIAFTVRTDGHIADCRVLHPSGDVEADAITCRLALDRFRFRPATNSAGNPVESQYGWKQSWFRADGR